MTYLQGHACISFDDSIVNLHSPPTLKYVENLIELCFPDGRVYTSPLAKLIHRK
jgi:hypothetical protein